MNKIRKVLLAVGLATSLVISAFAVTASTGQFTGTREYAIYGYVKVQAVFKDGKLTDVQVLESPNHAGRSKYISAVALPWLIKQALQVQSARVDVVSGATLTSEAFAKSLDAAIKKAGS